MGGNQHLMTVNMAVPITTCRLAGVRVRPQAEPLDWPITSSLKISPNGLCAESVFVRDAYLFVCSRELDIVGDFDD
jgi:hypothetical protein